MVQRGDLAVPVVGVARSGWGRDRLIERMRASLDDHGGVDREAFDRLVGFLRYVDGDYTDPVTFDRLREALGDAERPLHYLANPAEPPRDGRAEPRARELRPDTHGSWSRSRSAVTSPRPRS